MCVVSGLLTFSTLPKNCDVNFVVVGGAVMNKMLLNCEAVSFAEALLVKVSQTHLHSCQTPQRVITD